MCYEVNKWDDEIKSHCGEWPFVMQKRKSEKSSLDPGGRYRMCLSVRITHDCAKRFISFHKKSGVKILCTCFRDSTSSDRLLGKTAVSTSLLFPLPRRKLLSTLRRMCWHFLMFMVWGIIAFCLPPALDTACLCHLHATDLSSV